VLSSVRRTSGRRSDSSVSDRTAVSFWPSRPVLVGLILLVAGGGLLTYEALARARDSADASCLASIHAALHGSGAFDARHETSSWRTWSPDEVARTLARLQGYGDCDASEGAHWRSLLQVRSRKAGEGAELQLWLRGRPQVSSPWHSEGLQ